MKILNTVATKERAIEILNSWLTDQLTDDLLMRDTHIDEVEMQCGCGYTTGMKAYYEGGEQVAYVCICDCCGDDSAFSKDVIIVR